MICIGLGIALIVTAESAQEVKFRYFLGFI